MVQWLRICLPLQGTSVWSLVWKDSACRRATKPVHHNSWSPPALEPLPCSERSHHKEKTTNSNWRVAPTPYNWRKCQAVTQTQCNQESIDNWKKFLRLYWGGSLAGCRNEWKQVTASLACSPTEVASFFLIWGEVYARVRLEVGLRWFAHPSMVLSAVPCFCAQLFRNGSWVFCLCIFQSRICPKGAFTQLFLVPYSFFVFCIWRRDGSRCKFCNKGFQVPSLSQTQMPNMSPGCLLCFQPTGWRGRLPGPSSQVWFIC